MSMKKEKKGAISIDFLIGLVLLLLGFVIVLIFYFNIGGTGKLDENICHESVIFRATLPTLVESYIPLKCRTDKICITSGLLGDILKTKECKDLKGEKGITTIKAKSITDIEKVYAEEMLKCWQMMGEGKASLFNQYVAKTYGLGLVYPTCTICSRIAFDSNTITAKNFDFSRMDVSRYMLTHDIPGKNVSYFEYMASENGKVSIKEDLVTTAPNFDEKSGKEGELPDVTSDSRGEKLTTEEITPAMLEQQAKDMTLQLKESAILFMQISSPKHGESIKNVGVAIAGSGVSSYIVAPSLTKKAVGLGARACTSHWIAGLVCAAVAIVGVAVQQIAVTYNRAVTSGYCGDLTVGTEARDGCSAVRTVNYNITDISSYCKVIESIA